MQFDAAVAFMLSSLEMLLGWKGRVAHMSLLMSLSLGNMCKTDHGRRLQDSFSGCLVGLLLQHSPAYDDVNPLETALRY